MPIRMVPYVGLMIEDSILPTPDEALAQVLTWIGENTDLDVWDVHEFDVSRTLRRVHWAGDDVGMCGPDHPDARAVVVSLLPTDIQTQLATTLRKEQPDVPVV